MRNNPFIPHLKIVGWDNMSPGIKIRHVGGLNE
jgi:hypothetical protein